MMDERTKKQLTHKLQSELYPACDHRYNGTLVVMWRQNGNVDTLMCSVCRQFMGTRQSVREYWFGEEE